MKKVNLKREILFKVYVPYFVETKHIAKEDIIETLDGRIVISEEKLEKIKALDKN